VQLGSSLRAGARQASAESSRTCPNGSSLRAGARRGTRGSRECGRAVHPCVQGLDAPAVESRAGDSRFIPACRGSTISSSPNHTCSSGSSLRAGARRMTCGAARCFVNGSSLRAGARPAVDGPAVVVAPVHPCVQGLDVTDQRLTPNAVRFIPACMGSTMASSGDDTLHAVHPCVQGLDFGPD